MSRNIKFVYLYRDADNYRYWGEVVFANPSGLAAAELTERLARAMMIDQTFIADQIRVPEVFPYTAATVTDADHCFHEYHAVEDSDEPCSDQFGRTVSEFIDEVARAGREGWMGFDSADTSSRRFKLQF